MQRKRHTLDRLFKRLHEGKANSREKQHADNWFNQLDLFPDQLFKTDQEEDSIRQRMQTQLKRHVFEIPQKPWLYRLPAWTRQVAAAILLVTVSALAYLYFQSPEIHTIAANAQAIRRVTLPDGTQITLNRSSTITWDADFGKTERRVSLSGEGYFDVRHDRQHPFIVQTGNIRTRVLGTRFDVDAYPAGPEIKVSLIQGHVAVTDRSSAQNTANLLPGNMIAYDKQAKRLTVKPTAVEDPALWLKGGLVFNDIPLSAALEKIKAHYQIDIRYDRSKLQGKTVTASFHEVTLQEALRGILFMHELEFNYQNNIISIKPAKN